MGAGGYCKTLTWLRNHHQGLESKAVPLAGASTASSASRAWQLQQIGADCLQSGNKGEKIQSTEQFQLLIAAKEIVTFSDNKRLSDLRML